MSRSFEVLNFLFGFFATARTSRGSKKISKRSKGRTSAKARGSEKRRAIPTLSLFSGAGGLDHGFLQAGFDVKACVEIEPAYCETLRANVAKGEAFQKNTVVHCVDIRKFDTTPYKKLGIECVIGGPPCQTFSAAGRRAGGVIGTEDLRGQLFQAYCRIIKELKPKIFVFENVYGLPGANGGGPWRQIIRAFSALGYNLKTEVIDAADYGVPQHRERLLMVGFRSKDFVFPMPTHGPDSFNKKELVSVEQAIADLQDAKEPYHDSLGGMYGHLLPLVPEGLNYSFFTAEMGHPEPQFAWRSKFHDLLYKVARNEPCRTIKAQPGKFTGPFHWKNRHFTIAELKRLQTFPDNYELVGSFGKVMEQIGNSVPPRLAYVIATSVREQLVDGKKTQTFPVRSAGFTSTFRQRQRQRTKRFDEIARIAIAKKYKAKTIVFKRADVETENYFLNPKNLFDRRKFTRKPHPNSLPLYQVAIKETGNHISIQFDRANMGAASNVELQVAGLKKYLPDFESLSLRGRVAKLEDVFHVWSVIEDALIKRSRFFTLIDIYGHYANRGDTIKVSSEWALNEKGPVNKAINWFGNSQNCGDLLLLETLQRQFGLKSEGMRALIGSLREVRFDVRSSETHPILGKDRMICTYPFPLLSPRALVESRAQFTANSAGEIAKAS